MIEAYRIGLALLGFWLTLAWQSLGWFGQSICVVAAMLIILGIIGTLLDALATWMSTPSQAEDCKRALILSEAIDEAYRHAGEYWHANGKEREEA